MNNTIQNSTITDDLKYVMTLDKLTEYLSCLICLPGALCNAILIYLIWKRTPIQMRSYAIYILNFALFDFATCIISFFSQQQNIFSDFSLVYIFHQPCKYVSPWFCYFCHCFMCHALAHSQWILLGSFIYRVRVLTGETPTAKDLIRNSVALYSMSLCFLLVYVFDNSDSDLLFQILTRVHPEYHYDDESIWKKSIVVSGNISAFAPITLISILYMTIPCVPIYCAILYFRHNTRVILNNPHINLSPTAKSNHVKLIRALTVQAGIPIFWLVASGIFTMSQFGIIGGFIPENIYRRLMDCIPLISPIVTIIFVQPYREGLLKVLLKNSGLFVPNIIGSSIVDVSLANF
nr:chemosensory receptor [Caenorhabditis elegans]